MRNTKRVVIKVGSGALQNPEATRNIGQWISQADQQVIVVSSGARVFGRQCQGTEEQRYMDGWQQVVEAWAEGVNPRQAVAFLACKATFESVISGVEAALEEGSVPIVNERFNSDFGNNDPLAGELGLACGADSVALLGEVSGILDDSQSVISRIPLPSIEEYRRYTGGSESESGTGGADAKLDLAAHIGAQVRIIVGPWDADISALLDGRSSVGTHFVTE